jgi:hypothetical protein
MLRYLTIPKFAAESGYTEDAIRSKIRDGVWAEGAVWHRAPDNRILIDVLGFEKWVEAGAGLQVRQTKPAAKVSPRPLASATTGSESPKPLR